MSSQKFLYLDFDGVLHPNFTNKGNLFCHIPKFEEAIQWADINVVISSSWRFQESPDWLIRLFSPRIRDSVIGFTGDAHIGQHARWHEIVAHVKTNQVIDWMALDDAKNEFPDDCQNLILCDGKKGLDTPQLDLLKKWLMT